MSLPEFRDRATHTQYAAVFQAFEQSPAAVAKCAIISIVKSLTSKSNEHTDA
jgi:hypothetical protein